MPIAPASSPPQPFNRAPSRRPPPAKPRSRARAAGAPPLAEFVLLSMLLHALAIMLFGAPAGGSREGRAMWGSLNVILADSYRDAGPKLKIERDIEVAPPKPRARLEPRKAQPPAPAPLPQIPPPAIAPAAPIQAPPVVPRFIDRLPAPEPKPEPVPPPQVPPPTENQVAAPVEAPAPPPAIAAPVAPPAEAAAIEAPPAPAPPIERVPAPPVEMRAVPAPAPAPPPVEVQAIPVTPPTPQVERQPVEVPSLPTPRIESTAPAPAESATVEQAPVREMPPTPAPAPQERAAARPPERAPPAEREPAASSPFRAPSPGEPAIRRDTPSPDYDPTAAPSIDLEAARKRAGQLAREGTGNRALLAFPMPPVPKPKSKLESAIENARKPDCRTAYSALGLAAVVPLIANEFGEGTCRW